MEMKDKLPVKLQTQMFVFHDDRLNMFANAEDLSDYLSVLKGIVQDLADANPFAYYITEWPPIDLVLPNISEHSPLKALYVSLLNLFDQSGFPVTAIINSTVVHHGPKEKSAIKTISQCRLQRVH